MPNTTQLVTYRLMYRGQTNTDRLNWDTVSQLVSDLFEPEIEPNLPDNSKNPKSLN